MKFSNRINIEESATVAINSLVKEKIAKGENVINLSAGEPVVEIPDFFQKYSDEAFSKNMILYPPAAGLPELREVCMNWLNNKYSTEYSLDEIVITPGGKFGISILLQSLVEKDDEVIIFSPYWVSYPSMVKLFDGKPVVVQTKYENNWDIDFNELEKSITHKTKVMILNNASNPNGKLYSKETVLNLLELCEKYDIFLISDEVYSELVYDNEEFVSVGQFPQFKDRVAIVQSFSKMLGLTGLRVGFTATNKELSKILIKLISQSTSGVSTTAQWIVYKTLLEHPEYSEFIKEQMQTRRDFISKSLKIEKVKSGLYYFLPIKNGQNSEEFCKELLLNNNLAAVPGIAFGQEGFVRITFGQTEKILKDAIKILTQIY